MALLVSLAALYFSRVTEPAAPQLVVQIDKFNESGFSFFVTNLGELPTVIRDFDLTISLRQGKGSYILQAGFSVLPGQLPPGENQRYQIDYASYSPRHTRWIASENIQEPFALDFLALATRLGNNLHCEIDVYFTSQRYFPNNIGEAEGSVNGSCFDAMKWFAENVGPLKVEESPN